MLSKIFTIITKSKKTLLLNVDVLRFPTCSISIICKIIGKKLIIYDSFEGLPHVSKKNKTFYPHLKFTEKYKKGMYRGSLEIVKKNLKDYGEISVCIFRKGYFDKTLPSHKEKIGLIFLDVDFPKSIRRVLNTYGSI